MFTGFWINLLRYLCYISNGIYVLTVCGGEGEKPVKKLFPDINLVFN